MAQFRQMIGLRQLGEGMDKYSRLMVGMPTRIDEVLTLAAHGGPRVKVRVAGTGEHRRQRNALAVGIALLMFLSSCGLLADRFADPAGAGKWVERLSAIAFAALGALLLRVVTRGQ